MPTGRLVYLDHHATTPVDPDVFAVMRPYFCEVFGNAASAQHVFGWEARDAVERARAQVAALVGATPTEIVFTSGATEANNLALKGVARPYRAKGDHIVTVATEHKAVLDPCRRLEAEGFSVTVLPVGRDGRLDVEALAAALTERTILVSVMHANNEIGVLQPLAAIGALLRRRGILFHTDAAQSVGKVPVDVNALGVALLSLSAHKLYGPKGVGALYVRRRDPRVRLAAELDGGGHERGLRSGTLDVPGIVGLGAAAEKAGRVLADEAARIGRLRDRFVATIGGALPHVSVNGHPTERLPGNVSLTVAGVEGESLMTSVSDVAFSSGSACTSASVAPSHVLSAIGLTSEEAHGTVRFGLGRFTTEEEVDYAAARIVAAVERLRALSPVWGVRSR